MNLSRALARQPDATLRRIVDCRGFRFRQQVASRQALIEGLTEGMAAFRNYHQVAMVLDRAGLHVIPGLAALNREKVTRGDVLAGLPEGMPDGQVSQLLTRLAWSGFLLPLGGDRYYLPKPVGQVCKPDRPATKLRYCLESLDSFLREQLAKNLGLAAPGGGHGALANLFAALSDRESVARLRSQLPPGPRQVLDVLLARGGSGALTDILCAMPPERRPALRKDPIWHYYSKPNSSSDLVALQQRGLVFVAGYPSTFVVPEEVRAGLPAPARDPAELCLPDFEPAGDGSSFSGQAGFFTDAVRALVFLEHERPATLKSGGFPKQALRKLSQRLSIADPAYAAFLMASLLELGLVARPWEGHYLPTEAVDGWLKLDAPTRLQSCRKAWLTNRHWCESSEDSFQLGQFGSGPGVRLRQVMLDLCREMPRQGVSLASLRAVVEFVAPLAVSDIEQHGDWEAMFARLVRSLRWLGLAETSEDPSPAIRPGRMLCWAFEAVPQSEPSQELVVQPNLELIAPPDIALPALRQLLRFAEASTAAGAIVAQLTVASIRRGVECGLTADAMLSFLSKRAAKGVPQTVIHFIRDVAGQYGQLELGPAQVYLKAASPEVLAEVMGSRGVAGLLRPLAPTVALLNAADQPKVLAALKQLGKLPRVIEDAPKVAQPRGAAGRRAEQFFEPDWDALSPPPASATLEPPGGISSVSLAGAGPVFEVFEDGEPIEIRYRDEQGALSTRIIEPCDVDGESVWAYCRLAAEEMEFKLANIVSFRRLAHAYA